MDGQTPYDLLRHEICVGLGFCGSTVDGEALHVDMFIPEKGSVHADEFVSFVFRAEGVNPDGENARKHAPTIRDAFVRHMGAETVSAQQLK